jgi:hypothetical protein
MSTDRPDPAYDDLQRRLDEAWRADLPGSSEPRVIVALPSFSLPAALLAHYGARIPAYEHRYLYCLLLARNPACRLVYVSSKPVHEYVIDYYLSLEPDLDQVAARERVLFVSPDDDSPSSLAEKLSARPDLVRQVRDFIGATPAMIEGWNVTRSERDLAISLGVPIHGSHPRLLRYGHKSDGRRLFEAVGVPCPPGVEGVSTPGEIVAAIARLRRDDQELTGAVVKLDDSGAGDGNAVIDLAGLPAPGSRDEPAAIRRRLFALSGEYVTALGVDGGVVEAWIEGEDYCSPSVQLTVTPAGEVVVLSTHDQILGGLSQQVYEGCRFPADEAYAAQLAEHGYRIGKYLAGVGVVGRFAVDFATVRGRRGWTSYALEINLRKGGTTHPFGLVRRLVGGSYDAETGAFVDSRGQRRYYVSTDNRVDPRWRAVAPEDVIERVRAAGLAWDPERRTGVVLHILECLPIDGRFGYTAIAPSRAEADELYAAVPRVMP